MKSIWLILNHVFIFVPLPMTMSLELYIMYHAVNKTQIFVININVYIYLVCNWLNRYMIPIYHGFENRLDDMQLWCTGRKCAWGYHISMNYYQLFRVKSWNNGMLCMFFLYSYQSMTSSVMFLSNKQHFFLLLNDLNKPTGCLLKNKKQRNATCCWSNMRNLTAIFFLVGLLEAVSI